MARPGGSLGILLGLSLGLALGLAGGAARGAGPGAAESVEAGAEVGERSAPSRAELESQIRSLETTVQELQRSRDAALREMRGMRAILEAVQARLAAVEGTPAVGAEPPPQGEAQKEEEEKEPEKVGTVKERAARFQAERDILERQGGVLLPGGQLVMEPGFQYTNIQSNRLQISGFSLIPAIIIGRIDVAEVDRDIFTPFLVTRYGLTDRLEAELRVPYLWREDRELVGTTGTDFTESTLSGNGIGDIDAALIAHVFRETRRLPDVIANTRVRFPTGRDPFELDRDEAGNQTEVAIGSGMWGLSAGATLVKAFDPVVLFGSGSYTWNLARKVGIKDEIYYGKIDGGDSFEYGLGLAFALNERVALSFSWSHRFLTASRQDGVKMLGSDLNAGTLFLGFSHRLSRLVGFNFNIGMGVTEDAPDLQLELRLPLRFPFRLPSLQLPPLPWLASGEDPTRVVLLDSVGGPS